MVEKTKTARKYNTIAAVFVSGLFFCFWSYFYFPVYMNTDLGWLFICLERFLQGGTYAQDFYETNPPLSFLVYLPSMALYKFFDISAPFSIYLGTLFFITISGGLFYRLLRHMSLRFDLVLALMCGFVFSQTWLVGPSFGLKDHLIFLWLLPLCLLQWQVTVSRKPTRGVAIPVAFLGALAICLKPHYALIPALFFIHRLTRERRLSALLTSPDFLTIAVTGVFYILIIFTVFPDYTQTILPATIAFYADETPFLVYARLAYFSFAALALGVVIFMISEKDEMEDFKRCVYILCALGALCFIPYALQDKGYHYQTLPFLGFIFMALATALFALSLKFIRNAPLSALLTYSLLSTCVFSFMAGSTGRFLTHSEFKNLSFHQKIDDLSWNKSYAVLAFKPLNLALPYYTDLTYGSRFGQLWPLMGLSLKMQAATQEIEKQKIREQMQLYIGLIAEDLQRYSPGVIAIPRYAGNGRPANDNFLNFMLTNVHFAEQMNAYNFIESYTIDEHIFEKGGKRLSDKNTQVTYDLFVLRKNTPQVVTEQE